MNRLVWIGLFGLVAACNKPSDDDCRKALSNMQHLQGTENLVKAGEFEVEVRACKAGSSKDAVQCAMKAQSLDDLKHCEFQKTGNHDNDDKKPDDKKPDDKKPE